MYHKEFKLRGSECWIGNMPSVANGKISIKKPFFEYEANFEGLLTVELFDGFIGEITKLFESRAVFDFTFTVNGKKYTVECMVASVTVCGFDFPIMIDLSFCSAPMRLLEA